MCWQTKHKYFNEKKTNSQSCIHLYMIQMKSLLFKWFKLCFWNTYAHTNTHRNTSHVHFVCVCVVCYLRKKRLFHLIFFSVEKKGKENKNLYVLLFFIFTNSKSSIVPKSFFFLGFAFIFRYYYHWLKAVII